MWKKCNTSKVQHRNIKTWKDCNTEKKQHEKNATRKKSNIKLKDSSKKNHEKWKKITKTNRVPYVKGATWKEYNMKKVQQEKCTTGNECNTRKVYIRNSETWKKSPVQVPWWSFYFAPELKLNWKIQRGNQIYRGQLIFHWGTKE